MRLPDIRGFIPWIPRSRWLRVVFDYVDTLILNFAIEYFRQYDTVLAFFKGGQYSAFRKQREVVNLVALSV